MKKTSSAMRENMLFMRGGFNTDGRWNIPLVRRQEIPESGISLIACSDVRNNDCDVNKKHGVHFFVDDYRFDGIYNNPSKSISRYRQYAFLLTPDFSMYSDMDMWRQIESVGKNRWYGAYWQSLGLTVFPTVSWSTSSSFEFCFDGIQKHSTVAVGMVGCKKNRHNFLKGYDAMIERLEPEKIICFGTPFKEMRGDIIQVDYRSSRKVVR